MTTRTELIEAMALSDALFDGRVREQLAELGRGDRQRYLDRAEAALNAIGAVAAVVPREATAAIIRALDNNAGSFVHELDDGGELWACSVAAADLITAPIAESVIEDDGA